MAGMILSRPLNSLMIWPWTRAIHRARGVLCDKIKVLIDEARFKPRSDEIGDFIEYLVAHEVEDEQIYSEALTMLFAGHDTTKNTLSWLLYFLCENPHVAQQLQREVDEELKGATPSHDDFPKLRKCRNAFMEALRLRPPAPGIDRVAAQDCNLGGYHIPKGTTLHMNLIGVLSDAKSWKNPMTFDPDRFETDATYAAKWVTFSVGSRNCIGQKFALTEGTLVIAMILQHFDVYMSHQHPVTPLFVGTFTPKGFHCKFVPRASALL